jgi:hypothetical protein
MDKSEKGHVATTVKLDAGAFDAYVLVSIGGKAKYSANKGNISFQNTVVIELRHVPERSLARLLSETTGRAKVSMYNVMGDMPSDVTVFQLQLVLDMSAVYEACRVKPNTPLALDFVINDLPPAAIGSFICATVKVPKLQNSSTRRKTTSAGANHSTGRKALTIKAPASQTGRETSSTGIKRCAAERIASTEAERKTRLDHLCDTYPNRMDVARLGGVVVSANDVEEGSS